MPTSVQQNSTNGNKGKERKGKEKKRKSIIDTYVSTSTATHSTQVCVGYKNFFIVFFIRKKRINCSKIFYPINKK